MNIKMTGRASPSSFLQSTAYSVECPKHDTQNTFIIADAEFFVAHDIEFLIQEKALEALKNCIHCLTEERIAEQPKTRFPEGAEL